MADAPPPAAPAAPAPRPLPQSAQYRVSVALAKARAPFFGKCIAGYGTFMGLAKLVERFHRHGHTLADVWSAHFAGHLAGAALSAVTMGLIFGAFTWHSHKQALRERLETEERFRLALQERAGAEGPRD